MTITYAINKKTKEHRIFDEAPPPNFWRLVETEDGWIPWKGGECPLPSNSPVEVRYRNGHLPAKTPGLAVTLRWGHYGIGHDIVAYKPALSSQLPALNSLQTHHSGRIYKVIGYANEQTTRPDEYPVTVIYENVDNGLVWCRPAKDWERSFTPISYQERVMRTLRPLVGTYTADAVYESLCAEGMLKDETNE